VLPDLDVIGFSLGVSYGDFLGHRGFFHSLFFAFLLSSTVMLLAFRKPPIFSKKWWLIWLFFFGVSSSHGILDTFNNAGLGIALLSPFDTTRYFSPWRPLVLAPMEIRALFTPLGKEMLLSELYWIWLPLILALIMGRAYLKIKLRNNNKTIKTEYQSVELTKHIFKYFFLAMLVLLLIAGLVVQAPWKLTTLLLIVLAACTVLPKPYRKWFWLSVAAIVLVLIIWVFLPDWGEWQPYKYNFDKELADLNDKYAIPDEQNAATIYNKLLENYEPNAMHPDFLDSELERSTRSEPWSSKDHPELAKWLQGHQDTITELMQASKIEKCIFPLHIDTASFSKTMERLSAMRQWVFLLGLAGNNDLAENGTDDAIEKYIAILQMAKHQYQQPTAVDMLVGIAAQAIALDRFKSFVVTGNAKEVHLSVIESALEGIKNDWSSVWKRLLDYEKLITKNEFARYYEVNQKGKIRLSRDPWAEMRNRWKEQLDANQVEDQQIRDVFESHAYLTYWQRKLIRAKTILSWFYMPSTPQKASEVIDTCFEKYYAMAEPDFDWKKGPKKFSLTSMKLNYHFVVEFLLNMLESPFYRIHDIYLRLIANKRGSWLIIALRRYMNKTGQWPEKLQDIESLVPAEILVDPFNNGSFVYKLTDDSFKLYSKGKNNIDQNGEYDYDWHRKKAEPDDWLIWPGPRKTRKTKEENADAKQQ
jgi:inner membrane protein